MVSSDVYIQQNQALFPKVILHVIKPKGAKLLPEADCTATLRSPFNVCWGGVLK